MMRQLVGVRLELGVAQRAILEHHRHRVRRARRLRGKQLRQRRRSAPAARSRSTPAGWCARSAGASISRPPIGALRRRQPPPPAAAPDAPPAPRRWPRSNRSLAYSSTPPIPGRRPSAPRRSDRLTDRSNFALALATASSRTASPAAQPPHAAVALQRQHHLEQRMPRQRARRVEHLHQPLKRQLLVAVGRKVAGAHPPHKLAEARMARRVGAQHQRVDEEPDQILQRASRAARDRAAERDVRRPAQAASAAPHSPACSTMNRLAPLAARKPQQPPCSAASTAQAPRCRRAGSTPQAAAGRSASSSWSGSSGQPIPPVRQLPRQRAVGIALIAQHRVLPQRVVGVLHRQRRQAPPQHPAAAPHNTADRSRSSGPSDQPSPAM